MHPEVLIVGCGRAKIWSHRRSTPRSIAARDAYTGALFRVSRRYAESVIPGRWYVLSAHYGLLRPDQEIVDYDERLGPRVSIKQRVLLASQISTIAAPDTVIYSIAGARYSAWLTDVLGPGRLITPLSGVAMFERMKILAEAANARKALW